MKARGFSGQSGELLVQTLRQVVGTTLDTDSSTSSNVFATLLSTTFTKADDTNLFCIATFAGTNSVTGTNIYRLTVNGSAKNGAGESIEVESSAIKNGAVCELVDGVPAGSVTVVLQWRVSAGTLSIRPATNPDTEHASLVVQEVSV